MKKGQIEKYKIVKIEKGTNRIVGYLSKGRRRWLPQFSKHEYLVLGTIEKATDEVSLVQSKNWEKSHNYYYQYVPFISFISTEKKGSKVI